MEPFFGGFLAFSPASIFIFASFKKQKILGECGLRGICICALILAGFIMIVDMQVASISMRYFSDFGWLLAIVGICVAYFYTDGANASNKDLILKVFVCLVLLGVFLNCWNLLSDGRYGELVSSNSTLYRTLESWFLPLM
ncbi:hypothetical protein SDC9_205298 [bioreactor metagenome]|uniref:Uncharacterized protein n=1 Tax=bioreactor metagenome TaxID=1076179 RepID=A0A645JAX1_9ZZZZ